MSDHTPPTPEQLLAEAEQIVGMKISFAEDPEGLRHEQEQEAGARARRERLRLIEAATPHYDGPIAPGYGCVACGGIIPLGTGQTVFLPDGKTRMQHRSGYPCPGPPASSKTM